MHPIKKLDLIVTGTDISHHYLPKDNKDFRLFRYKQEVYAVRYKNDVPEAAVKMWTSHKGEVKEKEITQKMIGKGMMGVVYEKTPDKAVKHGAKISAEDALNLNVKLLKQKFELESKGLGSIFVFGLYNVKYEKDGENQKTKIKFIMPKLEAKIITEEDDDKTFYLRVKHFGEFIEKLKAANELGYFHDDFITTFSQNPRNCMYTDDGFKLIDMDSGLGSVYDKEIQNLLNLYKPAHQWAMVADKLAEKLTGLNYPVATKRKQLLEFKKSLSELNNPPQDNKQDVNFSPGKK